MRKAIFICLLLPCLFYSCIKAPTYSIIPHIQFESVSADNIKIGAVDSISFSFTDGDGDIGISSTGTDTTCACCRITNGDSSIFTYLNNFNVFLIDSRDSCIKTFASGNAQPSGKYKDISGDILVIQAMSSTKCIQAGSNCANDTVVYSILLRDMAGHLSNVVHTVPIVVSGQ